MTDLSKPVGAALGWRRRDTRYLYQSGWYDVRQDDVTLPSGEEIVFTYVEHPGFVSVIALTEAREVVLIRSYRYTVDEWVWEVPAGGLGGKEGHSLEAVAAEELAEESGYVADGPLRHVAASFMSIGNSRTVAHVFLATGARLAGPPRPESTEVIEVHPTPVAEALRMAHAGEIADAASALALLLCEPLLTGDGPPG